ncbi:MAG TPA: haloacid dehalogenase type II [Vicinamibacterales bacterium]|nr:haloacid dehalogenase type II [Vicinamibacterales bacterium]
MRSRRDLIRLGVVVLAGARLDRRADGAPIAGPTAVDGLGGLKALVFDTFGTVVDYRSSIIREGEALGRAKHLAVDWPKFADAWRTGYAPSMNKVRTGELPWTKLDDLHRMVLDRLLDEFHVSGLTPEEIEAFNRAWHRLTPWPDAVAGLTRLKRRFVIAPLSNGNVSLMTELAKFAGLPWDVILGAELARHYKPDKEVYLTAASLLDLQPAQMMMVAAHKGDLRAARTLGFKTAFVPRPKEGPNGERDNARDAAVDVFAADFNDLASQLGA